MMIFITAGTQLPFDRLVKTMDQLAAGLKNVKIVAQALKSDYVAEHIEVLDFISADEFDAYVKEANLIVSHAGMGTIISALVKKKPTIVMPRLVKYNEHRNEHQLGTAKQMDLLGYVNVAYDEQELVTMVNEMWPHNLKVRSSITNEASDGFIKSINDFIKF